MTEHEHTDAYNRLVLFRLDALADDVRRVEDKVETLLIDVAMLKIKAGAWGAVAGMVPAGVALAVVLISGS